MKYSYIANSEKHSVVITKAGKVIEVRRGALTGDDLANAGWKTWGSEAAWRKQLPAGINVAVTQPQENRASRFLDQCRLVSKLREAPSDYDIAKMKLASSKKMLEFCLKMLTPFSFSIERFTADVKHYESILAQNPSREKKLITQGSPNGYYMHEGRMYPVYASRRLDLIKYMDAYGAMIDVPAGASLWAYDNGNARHTMVQVMVD